MLKDCSEALKINDHSSKAYYRSASALFALDRLEEALDCCDRCLKFDKDNKPMQDLRAKVLEKKEKKDKITREREEKSRREREEKALLTIAFRVS